MSHTTKTTAGFRDEKVLRDAIKQLQKDGLKCSLKVGGVPRMFYEDQFRKHTKLEQADLVLHLEECKYDVAFVKDAKTGEFEVITDYWAGAVSKLLGAPGDKTGRSIGRLKQEYQVQALTAVARRKGQRVVRQKNDAGEVKLKIAVR